MSIYFYGRLGLHVPDHPAFRERRDVQALLQEEARLVRAQSAHQERWARRAGEYEQALVEWRRVAEPAVLAGEAPPPQPPAPPAEPDVVGFAIEHDRLVERAKVIVRAAASAALPAVERDLAVVISEATPHRQALEQIAERANAINRVIQRCEAALAGQDGADPKREVTPADLVG